jgi:hypothetical protein
MECGEAICAIGAEAGVHGAKINLHCEPGVLDCVMQIASTSELDAAADRTQSGAAAELERAVCSHGAVDGPIQRGQP